MKIIDAIIKERGNPFWIPDAVRSELPAFFTEIGFKKGAEIGVSWGQNMIDYCEAGLEMFGVDPWQESEDNLHRKVISVEGRYGKTVEGIYELARKNLDKYPNCTLIRKTSMEALADFPDRSLDFVYIDANHNFGYVAMDLFKWTRKVKKGGIVAGHDYYSTKGDRGIRGVGFAVDAWVKTCDITNWYVLGRKERDEGERYDREFSFFFVKHW